MKTSIIVAAHKECQIPNEKIFLPVYAGSAVNDFKLSFQRDDEGDNISAKNKYYCELTALYWAYKNLKADYIGLCHYRRYFNLKGVNICEHNAILPKKRHYYIETVYDQFSHAHGSKGLDIAREIIKESYPEYLNSFEKQMNRRSLHIYNMFIMKYDFFIAYCDFLFDVLEKVEERLGKIDRLYGYIGERLLDVYLMKNEIKITEVPVITTEKINWIAKIYAFLRRKYIGKS